MTDYKNEQGEALPPIAVRMKRNMTAVSLHEPDRVPFMPSMNNFYALHYGVTIQDSMTDAAIGGGMNTHTLMNGSPQQVEEEVKRNMDILAPGGGFFMSNSIALDEVSPENMHAWRDAVEKHGKY